MKVATRPDYVQVGFWSLGKILFLLAGKMGKSLMETLRLQVICG